MVRDPLSMAAQRDRPEKDLDEWEEISPSNKDLPVRPPETLHERARRASDLASKNAKGPKEEWE